MHVTDERSPDFEPIPWSATLATRSKSEAANHGEARDAHAVIKQLEHGAGLDPVAVAPPSSPAALAYRVASRVLSGLVNDKHAWNVSNERDDTSGWGCSNNGYIRTFPTAWTAVAERRPDDILGLPEYRFWALQRDGEPIAILDTDGNVHLRDTVYSLPKLYAAQKRSLTATIGLALGSVLP